MQAKWQHCICEKLFFFNNFQDFMSRKYDCNWRPCKEDSGDFDSGTESWSVSSQMLYNHVRDGASVKLDPSHNKSLKARLTQYVLNYKTAESGVSLELHRHQLYFTNEVFSNQSFLSLPKP